MEKLRNHIEEVIRINDGEFEAISNHFSRKRVRKSQFLLHEGDEVKQEFLVLSGIYKVFYIDNEGKEHIVKFAQENCWMSDYKALFTQVFASMFIECLEAGEVLSLSLSERQQLSTELPKMEHFFKVKLTNEFIALEERIKLLLSSTPRQRYEEFAKSNPSLIQRIPKKFIAGYLGVCRETLSRIYVNC